MADSQPVLEVVEAIFESPDFSCDGVGGDFVLPGCVQYQVITFRSFNLDLMT
jgi:hypothetical protein